MYKNIKTVIRYVKIILFMSVYYVGTKIKLTTVKVCPV